eukprot:7757523-Pyramimonas_sp.AAC.1
MLVGLAHQAHGASQSIDRLIGEGPPPEGADPSLAEAERTLCRLNAHIDVANDTRLMLLDRLE